MYFTIYIFGQICQKCHNYTHTFFSVKLYVATSTKFVDLKPLYGYQVKALITIQMFKITIYS